MGNEDKEIGICERLVNLGRPITILNPIKRIA